MSAPIVAVREAIRARLLADPSVLALLRVPKVFSDPPRHVAFPHLAFASATARENGTATDDGHVVQLGLEAWSRGKGSEEALALAQAAAAALPGMPQDLAGHRLVNLIVLAIEPAALPDKESWRVLIRIRAVTEVVV